MFYRIHHQKIAKVLAKLNAQLLKDEQCYFAGGTAITLRCGEITARHNTIEMAC